MERPNREDFKPEYSKGFAEVASAIKQYSKKQDEYIDYLLSKGSNVDLANTSISTVWTIERLHKIVNNPDIASGFDMHLKHVWDNNNAKSVFTLTGLDVSELMKGRENTSGIRITNPYTYEPMDRGAKGVEGIHTE